MGTLVFIYIAQGVDSVGWMLTDAVISDHRLVEEIYLCFPTRLRLAAIPNLLT